jgi:metallo-beta-lactamase family protein
MPSLTFLGAARTVTGSKYLLEVNSSRVLVDCGLFQGLKELRLRNWQPLPVPAESIGAVVLTHAHIDHSGFLPRLFAEGFRGRVFCTPGTADLCRIVLPDAGRLAEEDAREANRHGYSKHAPALPLFTEADAMNVLPRLQPVGYDRPVPVAPDVTVTFTSAGHLLGSAFAALDLSVNGGRHRRVLFSGDIGRYDRPILPDPSPVHEADVLLVESTYGDRRHDPDDDGERLAGIVRNTVERGGKVIIPAFAIGRVEEIIYWLKRLEEARRIPVVPVFLDSPMAVEALKHYTRRSNELDPDMQGSRGEISSFMTRRFQTVATSQRSKELVDSRIPAVVISSSGMATGGRVLNHLRAALPNSRNTVLFSGYQAAGTRGRRLVDGEREVKIHGDLVPVNARIEQLHSMSAHADSEELLRWLGGFRRPPSRTFVVHGEPETADGFAATVRERLGWQVQVPEYLEQAELP